jgi:NTP pyrophosphatase (non-canonical NTP hydrolase)
VGAPAKAKLNVFEWVAILPAVAALVGEVVQAARDGRLDESEAKRIGEALIAIVAAVL